MCADYGLEERVSLVQSDLFERLAGRRYDLILANPPYVSAAAIAAFPPEYAAEPAIAHAGGADGLDIVRRILAEAGRHLTHDGMLVVEIGTGRDILEEEYPHLPFLWLDTAESEGEVFALSAADLGAEAKGADRPQHVDPASAHAAGHRRARLVCGRCARGAPDRVGRIDADEGAGGGAGRGSVRPLDAAAGADRGRPCPAARRPKSWCAATSAWRGARARRQPVEGHLRLGAVPSVITGILPGAIAALRRRHPGVHVEIAMALSAELVERLERRKLDAAIVSELGKVPAGFAGRRSRASRWC